MMTTNTAATTSKQRPWGTTREKEKGEKTDEKKQKRERDDTETTLGDELTRGKGLAD